MYRVRTARSFQDDLNTLDRKVARFILEKITWITQHPEVARFPLDHLPDDLKGLQKYRIGDYRVFFWIDHEKK